MEHDNFPQGWDAERVLRVLAHYEGQNEEEAVAEDEAAFASPAQTAMVIPVELVPVVRGLLAQYARDHQIPA